MSMKRIDNVEEALKLFEENTIKQVQTFETGNFKVGNKCFDNQIRCLSYLHKQGKIEVLSKIATGNYGFHSINAEMLLKEWKDGNLVFLYE